MFIVMLEMPSFEFGHSGLIFMRTLRLQYYSRRISILQQNQHLFVYAVIYWQIGLLNVEYCDWSVDVWQFHLGPD